MNPLSEHLTTGTFGELLVQLRLPQYEVQAAPPLKDTGNDLIAVRGPVFKAIQVKTTTTDRFRLDEMPKHYHLAALVALVVEGHEVDLQETKVFLLPRDEAERTATRSLGSLADWLVRRDLVDKLFAA